MKPRSHEEMMEQLDKIINDYRGVLSPTPEQRQAAVDAIRQFGFSEGDADRWLTRSKRRNP